MTGKQILKKNLEKALDFLREEIRKELKEQGHRASGKLIDNIDIVTSETDRETRGKILMEGYAKFVDKGVKPGRIPFSPGSRSGARVSKYIEALINWSKIVKPSMSDKERKGFAFAVATTAKREGHATRGSYRYSTNGRRQNFTDAINNNQDKMLEIINLSMYFDAVVEQAVTFPNNP